MFNATINNWCNSKGLKPSGLKSSANLFTNNTLITCYRVELRWVPGHKGIEGNKKAEEFARLGSGTHPVGPEPFIPISQGVQDKAIKDYLYSVHLKTYRNSTLSDKGKFLVEAHLRKLKYLIQ